jgi:hypothetical protein
MPASGYSTFRYLRTFTADLERTFRELNQANVAVYAVDARGLVARKMDPKELRDFRNKYPDITIASLQEFAARTGGLAWVNRNDLETGMRAALDDIRASYTLAYAVPEDGRRDSHQVRIRVRRPGVRLRYRKEYSLDAPAGAASDEKVEVMRAVLSPLDSAVIPMTAKAVLRQDVLILEVSLAAGALSLVRAEDTWTGTLGVLVRFAEADGIQCGSVWTESPQIKLDLQAYDDDARDGISLRKELQIPPRAATVRVLVRDGASGKIGTLSVPLPQGGAQTRGRE